MSKPTRKALRTWMLAVMARQAAQSEADIEAAIALSLPTLQMKFPADAFCAETIAHVAGAERFWNEAAVTKQLTAWCEARAAAPAYCDEAEQSGFTMAGKWWIDRYYRCPNDTDARVHLNMMRQHHPASFRYVMGRDENAVRIATYNGWMHDVPQPIEEGLFG